MKFNEIFMRDRPPPERGAFLEIVTHPQHARHTHFFAIFAVGKTRLKNATFKSRHRSSRGTCTLRKRLRVSNHFHTLYLICNENLTPNAYTFSEFLNANFRENSENFHVRFSRKHAQIVFLFLRISNSQHVAPRAPPTTSLAPLKSLVQTLSNGARLEDGDACGAEC